jgi:plastocyanin
MIHMIFGRLRNLSLLRTIGAMALAVSITPVIAGSADSGQILIKDFMFTPMTLKVKAGSSVTWANKDDEPHTVVNDGGLFRSSALDTGESFTYKFDKPGTYHFGCSIHPRMVGTIVVE